MAGHKHAAAMAEYAKDAAETEKPWERWEIRRNYHGGGWDDCNCNPKWYPESDYRRKPRTLTIEGVEVEAPLTEAIQGQTVYASDATGRVAPFRFSEADVKGVENALANGRLFATPEAAKAAYDAITALLTGKDAA